MPRGPYLGKREILAIVGPRQSGKTTLLRHLYETLDGVTFLDFEDRQTLELFTEDLQSFIDLPCRDPKTRINAGRSTRRKTYKVMSIPKW